MADYSAGDIPESIVQDIWGRQMFVHHALETTSCEPIQIVNPGLHNSDAGPDFLASQFVFRNLRWFGDVEIHTASGIWYEHKHHLDPRYNNVVLHVSLVADIWTGNLKRLDGTLIPEIVLGPFLEQSIRKIIGRLGRSDSGNLYCGKSIDRVPKETIDRWILNLARQRLIRKMNASNSPSRSERSRAFHRLLFRSLGYSKNTTAMEDLYNLISISATRLSTQLEYISMALGTAGLLPSSAAIALLPTSFQDYVSELRTTFALLGRDLPLRRVMSRSEWNFFRMRPTNFPDVRVAQAAAILHRLNETSSIPLYTSLRKIVTGKNPLVNLRSHFEVTLHSFFAPKSRRGQTQWRAPGLRRLEIMIINAIAPYLLLEAELCRDEECTIATMSMLRRVKPEDDVVTRIFKEHGVRNESAYFSQGLHELHSVYCSQKRCLTCEIGSSLLA